MSLEACNVLGLLCFTFLTFPLAFKGFKDYTLVATLKGYILAKHSHLFHWTSIRNFIFAPAV